MNTIDVHLCILDDAQDMRYLVNANTKLTIDMPYRDVGVAPSHDMRIDTDTHRHLWVLTTELLQDRKVVYVELYTQ